MAGLNRLAVDPTPVPAPVHLLCVPTPLQPDHTADLSALEQAVAALLPQLRGGDLVIIESTVPPGTLGRLAERSGRDDVLWAVAPERLLPSRALAELRTLPRVVGGLDAAATRAAAAFYREAFGVEVHPTDAVTATCVKLAENTLRDVQVAAANEIGALVSAAGADPIEVRHLANHHPRVSMLQPGIGVGGHCLPVDPWFLVQIAPELATLVPAARAANEDATDRALARIRAAADSLEDPLIGCLGMSYKAEVPDLRNSPALQIVHALIAEGRRVITADPHVTDPLPEITQVPVEQAVERADLVVLLVAHTAFRALTLDRCRVLDLCGALR